MNRCLVVIAGTVFLANIPLSSAGSHHRGSAAADKSAAATAVSASATITTPAGTDTAPAPAAATGSIGVSAALPATPQAPAGPLAPAQAPAAGQAPQYGQPQYGQPQYGPQPQYGQPQYGQPPQYGPLPPQYALPPPQQQLIVPMRTRKYWELSAVGGIVVGGVYVLSVLAGSLSYAGFYKGQWGFFVPLVGPALTLGNVGDQVCPCAASQLYAYGIGSVLTIAYVGALVPVILGGILTKKVPAQNTRVQLMPTLARDTYGLQLVSRF